MKAITLYVVLAFAFSCVFYALIIASGHVGGGNGWYATGLDWCPAAAALLTCTLLRIDIGTIGWRWRDRLDAEGGQRIARIRAFWGINIEKATGLVASITMRPFQAGRSANACSRSTQGKSDPYSIWPAPLLYATWQEPGPSTTRHY